MKTFAALLTVIALSISAAYGADAANAERKRAPAKQTHKMSKPEELFAGTKKYLARQASKTAEIIKINAANIRKTVWPEAKPAAKAATPEKSARPDTGAQPAKSD
jgi:hypothetical protein